VTLAKNGVRVSMVIQSFSPIVGGAELQLQRLLPYLLERGIEVTVLTRGHPERPSRESIPGAEVRRSRLSGRSSVASAAFVAASLAYLVRRRRALDVVHTHGALSEGTIALGASAVGLPTVVMILRSGYWGDLERLLAKPLGSRRLRALTRRVRFIALSAEGQDELVGHGVAPDRIFEIPYGVDCRVYRPADERERERLRRELALPASPVVLYVGRLSHVKRVETVVEALVGAPGAMLVVVGDGPERPALERRARGGGLEERVRFVGFSDRVPDYLRAADVFVLPSRAEGMSNALLEAMACGLACAATPVSGSKELLSDGRGVLVEEGDVDAWARTLAELSRNEALRARLGVAASRHVRANFSIERQADRLAEAYRALAGDRRPSSR
jgi:glycosyltransferase involved in cell wall biosynthesis